MLRVLEIKQPQIVTVDKRQPQIATVDKRIRKDTFPQHSKSGKVVFKLWPLTKDNHKLRSLTKESEKILFHNKSDSYKLFINWTLLGHDTKLLEF